MSGLALIFPGQASQVVGMGVELRARSARARKLFALADSITGLPVSRLTEEGPLDRLTATEVAQPAVVTGSLAALAVLEELHGQPIVPAAVAGHSVGELAAYVAAGALEQETALRLVHERAQAMAAACAVTEGTMAAVLGLDEGPLQGICQAASDETGSVELANLNAPGQLVISGERAAVERASQRALEAGARRVLPLNVSGPFHSVYMRPAAERLAEAIGKATFQDAETPVVANVTALELTDAGDLREELTVQVFSPVRWIDVLRRLEAMGCGRFLELGPGQVLAGLVKRTLPDARVASFGRPANLEAAAAVLAP